MPTQQSSALKQAQPAHCVAPGRVGRAATDLEEASDAVVLSKRGDPSRVGALQRRVQSFDNLQLGVVSHHQEGCGVLFRGQLLNKKTPRERGRGTLCE